MTEVILGVAMFTWGYFSPCCTHPNCPFKT
jgi:hypothetical protein